LENVEIADFMPLLIQSICKDAEDPQNHCIFDSRTRWHNNKIQKFQMYQSMIYLKMIFVPLQYNYILALEAEERGENNKSKDKGRLTYQPWEKTIYQELLDQAITH
jgi:hypothetical protein